MCGLPIFRVFILVCLGMYFKRQLDWTRCGNNWAMMLHVSGEWSEQAVFIYS